MIQLIKKQIPNILTVLRLILTMMCTYYAWHGQVRSLTISLVIFCIASLTDFFDGYLARRWKIVTSFGKLMDPIADKFLVLGMFFVFTFHGIIPLVLTLIILSREVLLTGVRLLVSKQIVLAARYSGKVKTFAQIGVLLMIYVTLIYKKELHTIMSPNALSNIIYGALLIVTMISIYSGFDFLYHNRKLVGKELGIKV